LFSGQHDRALKQGSGDVEVLVIGATGKTGRQVTDALVARGALVRAASRKPGSEAGNGGGAGTGRAADAVTPVRFDWADRTSWAPALGTAEGLYIVGPTAEPDAAVLVHELLAAAPGVRRVVLLSVIGADRLPDAVPMAAWERDVRESGRQWTILRPNWFQQNFGDGAFTTPLREQGALSLPAGDAALSFVDTRDIAEVAAIALTEDGHAGETYQLTGPQAFTYGEALAVLGAAAGRELRYTAADPEAQSERMRAAGVPERSVLWQAGLHALIRQGANAPVTDTVRRITGHEARPLAGYAAERAEAWQQPARVA
jgi:uncharacterized protein YbjT (DUF2867 family)